MNDFSQRYTASVAGLIPSAENSADGFIAGFDPEFNQPTGIFGRVWGQGRAGLFQGPVRVEGDVEITGRIVGRYGDLQRDLEARINQLLQQVQQLQQQVQSIYRTFDAQQPVVDKSRPLLDPPQILGPTTFAATGRAFAPNATITLRMVTRDGGIRNTITNAGTADASGNYFSPPPGLPAPAGGIGGLTFAASDGRADPADFTSLLWSNSVRV